ncbi:MAG: insulinase family protein, partial [candidate division Zixibacteria bacterium]|nr:insulinase family protein [candidate division Zixibacteria bacterium]
HELESVGGSLNAFTSREQTCYYARILDRHLERAIDVLADILRNSRFDPQELEKEKNVIIEEIKDIEDSPGDWVHDLFAENIWKDHPLGRPIIGRKEKIKSFDRPKVLSYLSSKYLAEQVVVAASGNVSHAKLVGLAKSKLTFPSANGVSSLSRTVPAENGERSATTKETSQAHICLGFPSDSFKGKERHASLVLNTILGGGMSSRLFQKVREEKALAYSIYSYHDFYEDAGILGIYLATSPQQASPATELVLDELAGIKKEKLPRREFESAKEQLKGNLVLGLESTSSRMNRLGRNEMFLGEYVSLKQALAAIESVKPSQVVEKANQLFSEKRLSAVFLGSFGPEVLDKINWAKI